MPTPLAVSPERYEEAMRSLVPSKGQVRALLSRLQSGDLHAGGFFAIEGRHGSIVAAALLVPAAGRAATIVASRPSARVTIDMVASLIEAAARAARDVDLLQALLSPDDADSATAYLTAGFHRLALLHTMISTLPRRSRPVPLPHGVTLQPATDTLLVPILEATYADTLDCPGLHGLRRTIDIIAGHRAGGVVHEDLWLTVRRHGQAVGCVLVTCGPRDVADLAYLGMLPAERACGLGRAILNEVIHRLVQRGAKTLRLAVDSHNAPALRLYSRAGFTRRSTQQAVIRSRCELQAAQA